MMNDEAVRKLVQSLRESAHTFDRNETHTLPAMQSFIRRHVREIRDAADQLEHSIGEGRHHGKRADATTI